MKQLILILLSVWIVSTSQAQEVQNLRTKTLESEVTSTVPIRDVKDIDGTLIVQNSDVIYIQNKNITGNLDETHDVISIGNHVTTTVDAGDVTTTNANITLRASTVLLDSGTYISIGSTLKTINP